MTVRIILRGPSAQAAFACGKDRIRIEGGNAANHHSFGLRQEVSLGNDRASGRGDGPQMHPDLPELLKAAGEGDDRAWRGLVDLYARRVYALARSRLGGGFAARAGARSRRAGAGIGPFDQGHDAAEEVTQSVFVTVASKLGSGEYTEQGRFESWLFRVAMNRIRDEVRRLKRHAEPTDPEAFNEVSETRMGGAERMPMGADGAPDESIRTLRAAMERLSDADREVVELRHHAGLSFKQMADLLNEPLGTLLARHHRALRKLKELITASDPSLAATGEPS
jgi:RNA polymerase sigma-70 factor (ECF subfamily)